MRFLTLLLSFFLVSACQQAETPAEPTEPEAPAEAAEAEVDTLAALLAAQPEEVQARYPFRNPQQTIEFFGIEPGMTVLEGLPGRGWYTKVLLQYLGSEGELLVANYELDMYPLFSFASEEFLAMQAEWQANWQASSADWGGDNGASTAAFHFGSMPEEMAGTADAVFFPRVLHNLARFQNGGEGPYLDTALADVYAVLKPGGVFGVVQHEARDDRPDEWADGSRGYLKKQFVIDQVTAAGFEFVGESDINQNPADQPSDEDFVWRLPPSLSGTQEGDAIREEYKAIGESNRMTLKFRKPE